MQVRYVIQDGNSTDGTAEVARAAADGRATAASTADSGMYEALARGFDEIESQGGADWYCYLNAGDLWDPRCLEVVNHVAQHTDVSWLCGLHAYFGASGSLVNTKLPFRYRRNLLRAGAYGRGLPTVQQESTFWRADLHERIDMRALSTYAVAGDSYLWWTFAERTEPTIIEALLGGFRYHGGHLGVSKVEYRDELTRIAGPLSPVVRARIPAERALWEQPARVKRSLNPHLFLYDTSTGGWRSQEGALPPCSVIS